MHGYMPYLITTWNFSLKYITHGEYETKYRDGNFYSYARTGHKISLYDA